ncbi:hypothetical protein ACFX2I_035471 [Malus domestica]
MCKQTGGSLYCSGGVSVLGGALGKRDVEVDCLKSHHSVELQEEEEPEVDHDELHYAVQPQKTKANAAGTNPQTSDDQVKSDHQILASGQSSSSCLSHSYVRAYATVYSPA